MKKLVICGEEHSLEEMKAFEAELWESEIKTVIIYPPGGERKEKEYNSRLLKECADFIAKADALYLYTPLGTSKPFIIFMIGYAAAKEIPIYLFDGYMGALGGKISGMEVVIPNTEALLRKLQD